MHQPVLLHEVVEYLRPAPGNKIVDCTLDGGGHARAILERITPGGVLVGIDCDREAIERASENLEVFKDNIKLVRENFRNIDSIAGKLRLGKADGFIFDLGLSSLQLEDGERGFSIKQNGPLDMRMDRGLKIDGAYLINRASEFEITNILREFGEERFSRRIAKAIVGRRPIQTTGRLAEVVTAAVPARFRRGRIHPATRTFQAVRIAVNRELEALAPALDGAMANLRPGGRICVISFHSLEDRIVKNKFKEYKKGCVAEIITRKPVTPQREEILINARSRSAKLRVAERS